MFWSIFCEVLVLFSSTISLPVPPLILSYFLLFYVSVLYCFTVVTLNVCRRPPPFLPLSPSSPQQRCIINNTHRLVELCVAKLSQDWFPLLELLAMATNPHCKFHIYNGTRPSETVPAGVQLAEDELFARPPDPRSPKVRHCQRNTAVQTSSGFCSFGLSTKVEVFVSMQNKLQVQAFRKGARQADV